MTKKVFFAAFSTIIVAGIALTAPAPARGQSNTSESEMVVTNLSGAKVGTEADGSTWTTIMFRENLNSPDGSWSNESFFAGESYPSAPAIFFPPQGHDTAFTSPTYLPVNFCRTEILTQQKMWIPVPPITLKVQLQAPPGTADIGIVEHRDAKGDLIGIPTVLTDPNVPLQTASTSFGLPLDEELTDNVGFGMDTVLLLTNATAKPVVVTLGAYDDSTKPGKMPFATVHLTVPPAIGASGSALARGIQQTNAMFPAGASGMVSVTMSNINSDFATMGPRDYLRLSAADPFGAKAWRVYMNPAGATSVQLPLYPAGGTTGTTNAK